MNRREFLKSTVLGPILPATIVFGIKRRPVFRDLQKDTIFNGQVFEAPWPLCHTVIVVYFGRGDKWVLLSSPYSAAQHNGSAMMVCYYGRKDGSDNPIYTQEQLQEKLKDWKLVNLQLELAL